MKFISGGASGNATITAFSGGASAQLANLKVGIASIKGAFNARHGGVGGLARLAHDLLLRTYLETDESHELSASFREKRKPDPSTFGH